MNQAGASRNHVRQLLSWLGDREHQLQMALDAAELGSWHWNPLIGELVCSERCRSLFGVDAEAPVTFEDLSATIHPADRAQVLTDVATATATRGGFSAEFRVILPAGGERWLHSFGRLRGTQGPATAMQMSGVVRDITDAHRTDAALARGRAEFDQLMQAAPVGIAKFDRRMRFLAVNQSLIRNLRLADGNVIGRSCEQVFPGMPVHWQQLHQRCLGGEALSGQDEAHAGGDGSVESIAWHMFPWRDDDNEIGGIVLLIDVHTAQRQLEVQARLWGSAFSRSADGMAIIEPHTDTIRCSNDSFARLLGYRPEELAGRPAKSLSPESEHERLSAAIAQADSTGSAAVDISRLHRNGGLMPATVNIVAVPDAAGDVDYRIVTVTDRSERERIQARLRHRDAQRQVDQRFRLLANSAPIGIVLANAAGAVTYANPAWLAITAMTLGEALVADWIQLVHLDDRERVSASWQKTLKGAVFDLEFRYRRPSGEVRWVQSHATELVDTTGTIVGYVCTSLDITERIQERAAADAFHSQVRALAERWQKLREVERVELAGSLRESVYQGLTALKGELQNQAPDSGLAAQAEALLNQLRHVMFELTPPGIAELGFAGALERFVSEQASRSGVAISLSQPESPPELPKDIQLVLYAVVQEAVSNALRHASATGVDVSFEVSNGVARLRVSDDGIGIEENDRNKAGCFGLLAASERLAHIGGTLRTLGIAGRGTRLEASVPVQRRPRSA